MGLLFVRPGHAMGLGDNRLALYGPLPSHSTPTAQQQLTQIVSGTAAWWDASTPSGLLGPAGTPTTIWDTPGTALIDLTGNGQNLLPLSNPATPSNPKGSPH